jgi:DNA-binding GntR family transcriptional regulator
VRTAERNDAEDGGEAPRTRSEAVFQRLLEDIVAVRLKPGETLFKDEIARALGVSRTPVSDAIARLAGLGLVTVIPQVNSFVSRISAQAVLESSYLRSAVEAQIVHDLASRPRRPILEALRDHLGEQMRSVAAGDIDAFHEADDAFHALLAELAGLPGMPDQIAAARLHLVRIRRLGLPRPGRLAISYAEHVGIVDEIEAGRPRRAAKAITAHIRHNESDLRRLQRESPHYFL